MTANIFDIQRGSLVDGPGIRTTVFLKGCNLKCKWCHNPESQSKNPQMMIYKNKCVGCGKCVEACPNNMKGACTLCGKCELVCPNDARKICGREYTIDEVMSTILKDLSYYQNSKGGITFSGGECMLQIEFLREALKKCKENNIHTAVDTAGCVPWESFLEIIDYTDLFLYDVKCFSEDLHKSLTGTSNQLILDNLKKLSTKSNVLVRIPIIPGANDDINELKMISSYLQELNIKDVELLKYHKMGENKYGALGMDLESFDVPTDEEIEIFKALFI